MTRTLSSAIQAISQLPDEVQDEIGQNILDYMAKLRALLAEIARDTESLGSGRGEELTPELWKRLKQQAATAAGKR
ncbi:MAG: hypothetical protein ACT4SY_01135 [Hyphomicrobiales bacterium]